jgi:putative two-component system response regulator
MIPTILLVDVDSADRDNWRVFLESQRFEVLTAANAKAAVETCRRFQPDLILLHDRLSETTGFELCQILKADPVNRATPVVLVVSSASSEEISRMRHAGADDCWGAVTSHYEALSRIQLLLQMKTLVQEQAKSVVLLLAQSLAAKEPNISGHSDRLAEYAVGLGECLHLTDEELETLGIASLLHDIGKVGVPDALLNKPGPLTLQERSVMQQHAVIGESICAPLKSLRHVLPLIRHHHERMDGSGYPDGLAGNRIPLKARILQIVDIYDALIMDRPYRHALPPEEALGVLRKEAACGWLDSFLVRRFCELCEAAGHRTPRGRSMLASYFA